MGMSDWSQLFLYFAALVFLVWLLFYLRGRVRYYAPGGKDPDDDAMNGFKLTFWFALILTIALLLLTAQRLTGFKPGGVFGGAMYKAPPLSQSVDDKPVEFKPVEKKDPVADAQQQQQDRLKKMEGGQ